MIWTVANHRTVFSAGPIQEVAVQTVLLPDGREIPDYYRIRLADFALVFATTTDDHVLLIRQYKHGLGRACMSFPGGALGASESAAAAAARELFEETGYTSDRWRPLGEFVTNANQRCNSAHLFIADACRHTGTPTQPDLEGGELVLIPRSELLTRVSLQDVGLASHAALLAIATHPALRA